MTIQRQYSLPNCTLTLEGIGEEILANPTVRPLMSVLVSADCRFVGHDQPISGGMDFFEHLVQAVSHYAQQVLSGVRSPKDVRQSSGLVEIAAGDHHDHHLAVKSALALNGKTTESETAVALTLSTVQLFDLVEAIDQALADSQTLPQLTFHLSPLPRRQAQAGEPMAKRALPVALGVSSVAIAAVALFFVPVPEVRRPEERPATSTPDAVADDPVAVTPGSTPEPTPDPSRATATTPDAAPVPLSDAEVATLLEESTPLADPEAIAQLTQQLREQIDTTWERDEIIFDEPLIYRVGVNPAGAIVGYRYINDAALSYVESTPLPTLRAVPSATPVTEPIGQYRVVLTPGGVVQVSPWFAVPETASTDVDTNDADTAEAETEADGPANAEDETSTATSTEADTEAATASTPSTDAATLAAIADLPEIRSSFALEGLNRELYRSVRSNWERRSFPNELNYRVTLDQEGRVLNYEPTNEVARDYVDDVPLDELKITPTEATGQADFRVVFTESGILEVSPWDGYPD